MLRPNVLAFSVTAEIRLEDEKGLSSDRLVQKSLVIPQIRCKQAKTMPYIRGRVISISTSGSDESIDIMKRIHLQFNSERFAWHYGWTSHKCYNSKPHVVDVMVLVERDERENRLFLAASYSSPGFRILSTKNVKLTRVAEEALAVSTGGVLEAESGVASSADIAGSQQQESSQTAVNEEIIKKDLNAHEPLECEDSHGDGVLQAAKEGEISLSLLSVADSLDVHAMGRNTQTAVYAQEHAEADEESTLATQCRIGSCCEI
jgi:hypothetical protein